MKAGADVNDRYPRDGITPLIRATYCSGDECEEPLKGMAELDDESFLIMSQPMTFSQSVKMKPVYNYIHLPWKNATKEDFLKCTMLLINAGADVNAINQSGDTALLAASISGNVECVS